MTEQTFLVPLETYLKVGLHIGTKYKNKYMGNFIYKVRPDGLAVLNIQKINERIKTVCNFLSKYEPQDIIVVGRRENAWKAVKLFGKATGIRTISGRYPPGMLTNPNLEEFTEAKVLIAVDPWPDRNAIMDSIKAGMVVISLCDTNNEANHIDLVLPCNNKGKKSLGLLFWILAKEYLKGRDVIKKDEEMKIKLDEFMEEE